MSGSDKYQALARAYHPELVGRRIRSLRIARELSQSEMARLIMTKPNTISQIESGVSRPATDVELRIKAFFGVTIDWIKFGEVAGLPAALANKIAEIEQTLPAPDRLSPDARVSSRKLSRPARKTKPKKT